MGRPTIDEMRAKRRCQHRDVTLTDVEAEGIGDISKATALDAEAAGLQYEHRTDRLVTQVGVCMTCYEVVGRLGVVSWEAWL